MTRAAIYVRYSSDRQSARSAEDQARLCQERADREGWQVEQVYSDLALSGTVRDRPGLNAMLDQAERFDVVVAEAIDRISRDQEDIASIWKRLRHAGVRLVTLSEGDIGTLHIGLGGTMAALYVEQLAEKTRRGQIGRVEAGRIPGGLSYGYAMIHAVDERGHADRGRRAIDPDEANVVRRIFSEYLTGRGPKQIAQMLNAEGVVAPAGGKWAASTIIGNRRRGTGILHNALYDGRIVYNRQRFEKHPTTRRRLARVNPVSEWRTAEVPELAIVDRETWNAVQQSFAVLEGVAAQQQRRPQRLLSGLVRCGVCGGSYIVRTRHYWACSSHAAGKGCENAAMIATDELEARVIGALRDRMLDPELVAEYVAERQRLQAEERQAARRERSALERQLARAQAKLNRIVDAIADGRGVMPELLERMRALACERDAHAAELERLGAEDTIAIHPNLAEIYRRQIGDLVAALRDPDNLEARSIIRDMIETIVATPRKGRGVDLALQGRLAAILSLTQESRTLQGPASRVTTSLVAGAGFEPATFRL